MSNAVPFIEINGRRIGEGYPTYIVAELSANHNQNFQEAVGLIHAAKEAGADAVKLQTYTPDTMTINSSQVHFQIAGGLWGGRTLYDLYEEAHTPWEWYPGLKQVAEEVGIHLFSTPFDFSAVEFLEELEFPAYKIASFEVVDIPLIKRIACTGKPLIMSTGMASLEEIDEAVTTIRDEGNDQLVLLHCVSAYPASPEDMNLRTTPNLAQTFGVPAGLSDHSLGISAVVGSVALGACLIEKHFTASRSAGGPDSVFSIEPVELRQLVESVRTLERALGKVCYEVTQEESKNLIFRRSLFSVANIKKGELLTEQNVRSIRPGNGLPPKHIWEILGRTATRHIPRGTPLSWDLIGARESDPA